jgi:hypothetical protein
MKSRRLPPGVANRFKSGGRNTAAPPWSWLELDLICGDWIVICSDEDCNHGVVECAGECIPF